MSETPSLVGQVISGCEILEKTAEGGMGAVYRARHKALNRIVCVKILSPSLSTDRKAIELFLTEARAIAEVDHPNIVNVYNVGKEKGYYFIVMSFVEGQTLSALLKKNKVLEVGKVLDLFDGVLQGLEAAHEKGIIHRDIKPSNILVTPQGQAKLVDFGIAKKVNKTTSTKTTELAGTAYFIAPEQALGQNLDIRADLYSVGASLYYVLTGQFPYNGKNTIEIIQKHISNPVPNPCELRRNLPAWLGPAIQKLMSKNPDSRFQTAKETYLYFRKMRAEDQLRLESGNAGRAINLGEEGPLTISQEDKLNTTLHTQRTPFGKRHTTPPTQHNILMPQINGPAQKKAPSTKPAPATSWRDTSVQMQDVSHAKTMDAYTSIQRTPSHGLRGAGNFLKQIINKIGSLLLFLPLFAVVAAIVVYSFYSLGHTCSPHATLNLGAVHDIVSAFAAAEYAPNQMLMIVLCALVLLGIFAVSMFKAFAHSTTTFLALAMVSFLAGFFTPQVPFMELVHVPQFVFSSQYYLCYLVVALAWGLSICWTLNRSFAKGILGASLVLFCITLAFLSSRLSIAPNSQSFFFMVLFYSSLFCGVCAAYYLMSRSYKDSIILPFCLFLVAVAGIWIYTVSGLAKSLNKTLDTLASRVEVTSIAMASSDDLTESQQLRLSTDQARFRNIDRSNEFSHVPLSEVVEKLQPRIRKATPNVFTEETLPLFAHLLAPYYQGGKQHMQMGIWKWALAFPLANFNENAQENDAYFFLITLLCALGLLNCAGAILRGDEL